MGNSQPKNIDNQRRVGKRVIHKSFTISFRCPLNNAKFNHKNNYNYIRLKRSFNRYSTLNKIKSKVHWMDIKLYTTFTPQLIEISLRE